MLRARNSSPSRRIAQEHVDVDRSQVELHATRFHPVEVKHLRDHPAEAHGVGVDIAGKFLDLVRGDGIVPHDLAEALDAGQRSPELVADHRHELALQLVEALEAGEVGHRGRFGLVSRGDVLEHRQVVIDRAARGAHRSRAPVHPERAAVGAHRFTVQLDGVDVRARARDAGEHFRDVCLWDVVRETRADDDPRARSKQRAQARVGVHDPKLGADSSEPCGRMAHDLVHQSGPLS